MKTMILAILAGVVLIGMGCVGTVNDRTTPGMPFGKDRVEGRYERPVDPIFEAAKEVIKEDGVLVREGVIYNQTNVVKTAEGKVNQCNVWVRVEGVEPNLTQVTVQARTSGGNSNVELAHQLEKEIALKLK